MTTPNNRYLIVALLLLAIGAIIICKQTALPGMERFMELLYLLLTLLTGHTVGTQSKETQKPEVQIPGGIKNTIIKDAINMATTQPSGATPAAVQPPEPTP